MSNITSEQMQNWKRLLIMDPILNNLFTQSLNVKDFIHDKILILQHQQIVHTYSKLSTVKHALSKRLQKQVEAKHQVIQQTFKQKHRMKQQLKLQNQNQILKNLKTIESYNMNYQKVKKNTLKLQNINKILKFAKALEKLKINCRLLKTFMKDYNTTNYKQNNKNSSLSNLAIQSLNLPKVSKILKQINGLVMKNDFTGIKYYQNQKENISNFKMILFTLTQKQLTKRLQKYIEFIRQYLASSQQDLNILSQKFKSYEDDIIEKIRVLYSINKLKQFLTTLYKKSLTEISSNLKILFNKSTLQQFREYFLNKISPQILTTSLFHIRIQQIFHQIRISQQLSQNGLTNMFVKYVQKVRDYFRQLIKWNMEQNNKQNQKKYQVSSKNIQPNSSNFQIVYFQQILELSTKNQSLSCKCSLIFKYPTLLIILGHTLNRVHEQILLHAHHHKQIYQFSEKKQQIMLILQPLGIRFHEIRLYLISDKKNDKESYVIKTKNRISLVKFFYDKILTNQLQQNCLKSEYVSSIIQQTNEGLIRFIDKQITLNQQKSIKQNNQCKNQQLKQLINICSQANLLKSYQSLEVLVNHIKRIQNINTKLNNNNPQVQLNIRQDDN